MRLGFFGSYRTLRPCYDADKAGGAGGAVAQPPAPPAQTPPAAPAPPATPAPPSAETVLSQMLFQAIQSAAQPTAPAQPAAPTPAAQTPTTAPAPDAQLLEQYKQLGDPATLRQVLAQAAQIARTEQLRAVAQAAGFGPQAHEVLAALAPDRQFEVREATVNGATVRQAVIKDGEQFVPLTDYAQRAWTAFLPALQAAPAGAGAAAPPTGTTWAPQQAGAGTGASTQANELMKRFQAQRDAAANPLKRP